DHRSVPCEGDLVVVGRHRQLFDRRGKILYGHLHLHYVLISMFVMIGTPHGGIRVEDHGPLVLFGNGEHGILACLYGFAAKGRILCKDDDGGFIGPAAVGLTVRRNGAAENFPSLLVRTAIVDGDVLALDRVMRTVWVIWLCIGSSSAK